MSITTLKMILLYGTALALLCFGAYKVISTKGDCLFSNPGFKAQK